MIVKAPNKKTFKVGNTGVDSWYRNAPFRRDAIKRCDTISAKFHCVVELHNEVEGVLYKVFP